MPSQPRVSCLMVTANRKRIASRAIKCFERQTYANKELVIIDDGKQDYSDLLTNIPPSDVNYIRVKQKKKIKLGELRNISLEAAKGDLLIQWDDDDWYHADRVRLQSEVLQKGAEACCLSSSLTHIQNSEFKHLPFIGSLNGGIPGSIMHVKDSRIRYPNYLKGEDSVYLESWNNKNFVELPQSMAYLFIRCYHGANTWDLQHFKRRMRNGPRLLLMYLWYKYCIRDLSKHPHFKLEEKLASTIDQYISDSRKLGIL